MPSNYSWSKRSLFLFEKLHNVIEEMDMQLRGKGDFEIIHTYMYYYCREDADSR